MLFLGIHVETQSSVLGISGRFESANRIMTFSIFLLHDIRVRDTQFTFVRDSTALLARSLAIPVALLEI